MAALARTIFNGRVNRRAPRKAPDCAGGTTPEGRLRGEDVRRLGAARAIVLRDKTVPLIRLADLLAKDAPGGADAAGPVVVVELGGELGAVQVDEIGERMEVILKPFDGLLAGMPGLAGSTLLGDGSVPSLPQSESGNR